MPDLSKHASRSTEKTYCNDCGDVGVVYRIIIQESHNGMGWHHRKVMYPCVCQRAIWDHGQIEVSARGRKRGIGDEIIMSSAEVQAFEYMMAQGKEPASLMEHLRETGSNLAEIRSIVVQLRGNHATGSGTAPAPAEPGRDDS